MCRRRWLRLAQAEAACRCGFRRSARPQRVSRRRCARDGGVRRRGAHGSVRARAAEPRLGQPDGLAAAGVAARATGAAGLEGGGAALCRPAGAHVPGVGFSLAARGAGACARSASRAYVVPMVVWDAAEVRAARAHRPRCHCAMSSRGSQRTLWMRPELRARWRESVEQRRDGAAARCSRAGHSAVLRCRASSTAKRCRGISSRRRRERQGSDIARCDSVRIICGGTAGVAAEYGEHAGHAERRAPSAARPAAERNRRAAARLRLSSSAICHSAGAARSSSGRNSSRPSCHAGARRASGSSAAPSASSTDAVGRRWLVIDYQIMNSPQTLTVATLPRGS